VAAEAYRCERCGAPLDVTPETIVAVCKYCGHPNWIDKSAAHTVMIVPGSYGRGREYFERYLEKDWDMRGLRGKIRIKSIDMVYVPFYTAWLSLQSRYYGVAEVTLERIVTRDKETYTETRTETVTVSGVHEIDDVEAILARRAAERTHIDPLLSHYLKTRPKDMPLEKVEWDQVKGEVLAGEISPRDALGIAKDRGCEKLHDSTLKRMESEAKDAAQNQAPGFGWFAVDVSWISTRIPCKVLKQEVSPLRLIPYYDIVYSYEGKLYRTVIAGWDGERVYGEEPITAGRRALYYTGVLAGSLLGGAGLGVLAVGANPLGGLALFAAGAILSYYSAGKTLADVRVETEE